MASQEITITYNHANKIAQALLKANLITERVEARKENIPAAKKRLRHLNEQIRQIKMIAGVAYTPQENGGFEVENEGKLLVRHTPYGNTLGRTEVLIPSGDELVNVLPLLEEKHNLAKAIRLGHPHKLIKRIPQH